MRHRLLPPASTPLAALALALFVTLVPASALAAADILDTEGLQGFGTVERHTLTPEDLDTTYTLLVRHPDPRPEGDEAPKDLPVVYLLDGGATFPALAGYYRYLLMGEEIPELIVVGISYGTFDWRRNNQRGRDYTAPSTAQEHWGGIGPYLAFLEREVFPLIEERYPADPKRRIVFGQSLGGQAVIWAAMHRPDLFWGHIASNPALHRNLDLFLETPPKKELRDGASTPEPLLFVSSGSEDVPLFRGPALRWMGHWTGREHPWRLKTQNLEGYNHFSTLTEAFRSGLRWLFAPAPPNEAAP